MERIDIGLIERMLDRGYDVYLTRTKDGYAVFRQKREKIQTAAACGAADRETGKPPRQD